MEALIVVGIIIFVILLLSVRVVKKTEEDKAREANEDAKVVITGDYMGTKLFQKKLFKEKKNN